MALTFSDTAIHALVGGKFSLSINADQSLQFSLQVARYRVVGTKANLINGPFGDRFDTGDTTLNSLEYLVPTGEKHLFKLKGDVIGTAPAPAWSGDVSIEARQISPKKLITALGGPQTATGSDFTPVEVRGGFLVQG